MQAAFEEFIGRTQADELILVAQVYDHAARLRSYELARDPVTRFFTRTSSRRKLARPYFLRLEEQCWIDVRFF